MASKPKKVESPGYGRLKAKVAKRNARIMTNSRIKRLEAAKAPK